MKSSFLSIRNAVQNARRGLRRVDKRSPHAALRIPHFKGQALLEFSVLALFLGMLMAGAIDLGRAYYTSVVVTQMAGEGTAYAAWYPDRDSNYPIAGTCSQISVQLAKTIQDRARLVARERGMVIDPSNATITIENENGSASACNTRCAGTTIRVKVVYNLNDLFLPSLLGLNSITITRHSSQLLMRDAYVAEGSCDS
jgi:Flp pilus assembly protein TadG